MNDDDTPADRADRYTRAAELARLLAEALDPPPWEARDAGDEALRGAALWLRARLLDRAAAERRARR